MTGPEDTAITNESAKYVALGLPVLPTEPGTKQPARSGIALLTGGEIIPNWILVAIDVDDDRLLRVTKVILGGPVVGKRGKKGATLFVRAEKAPKGGQL